VEKLLTLVLVYVRGRDCDLLLCVFQFLWEWNDLLVDLVYLGGNQDMAP
jgi:hypothetical protein